jgi:hypothetical protein
MHIFVCNANVQIAVDLDLTLGQKVLGSMEKRQYGVRVVICSYRWLSQHRSYAGNVTGNGSLGSLIDTSSIERLFDQAQFLFCLVCVLEWIAEYEYPDVKSAQQWMPVWLHFGELLEPI